MRSQNRSILFVVFLSLWSLAGHTPAAAQAWPNGCLYQRSVTIDHTKVPNTDQSNFAVLISGTYAYLATTANGGNVTNANGYDILFSSDAAGLNPLPFEQESYSPSTGAIVYWVKVPTVSHTADTVIYMYYGNSAITTDQSTKTAVWDSNYKGVWHLPNGTTLTATDSTSNGNNGTNHGATAASGTIDGAASVNSGSYIDVGSNLSVSGTTAFTASAWVKPNGSFSGGYPLISGAINQQASIGFFSTTTRPYVTFHWGSGFRDLDSGYTTTNGNWYYIVGTYNGTTEKIFINGNLQASASHNDSITNGATYNSVIGKNIAGGAWLNATIDEVRFSNASRSADWIATEYNNQNSPATFYSIGSPAQGTNTVQITAMAPTTANFDDTVSIQGVNFGSTQGTSTIALNGTNLVAQEWSDTAIFVRIPIGAVSGYFTVTVNGQIAFSPRLTVNPYLSGWSGGDVGTSTTAGTDSYANGIETITSSGFGVINTYQTDAFHFVYQALSGDGSIVARVVSTQGSGVQAGVMIRETLNQSATYAFLHYSSGNAYLNSRTSTGGGTASNGSNSATLPSWVKLVRTGNTFTAYSSSDGLSWYQVGSTLTISMAQNVYMGLAVGGGTVSATFDSVSINTAANPAPVITSVSADTGLIGSQVIINGTGFGATQNGSLVTLNDLPMTINSWTSTSIIVTIASGATSGPLVVSVVPAMNNSNPVDFTVSTEPLPTPWQDQDVGLPTGGSDTYSNGTFTLSSPGRGFVNTYTIDAFRFVYQPLPGDGTITARVVSLASGQAGVIIRETMDQSSTYAYADDSGGSIGLAYRASTGAGNANIYYGNGTPPLWVKLVRTGNSFSGYTSTDGVTWNQTGTQTISMATNVYVGLALGDGNGSPTSGTFDNVSVSVGTSPFVTSVSPNLGPIGATVTITGSNFGASQGTSTVSFNGVQATSVTSWSDKQIVAVVPTGTPGGAGPVTVTVNSITSPGTTLFDAIEPVITSLSPPSAAIGGSITIAGTGFGPSQGSSQVLFNGVSGEASSWSAASITVAVPPGATSGPVTVQEDGVTSNGVQFSIIESLSITSISPSDGPVGTSVTITGTGFGSTQSNSTVSFFNSVPAASITSWSDTQVVAVVQAGTSTGPVSVEQAGQFSYGPWFTVTTNSQVTDSENNQSSYTSAIIGGRWVSLTSQGSGCSSCSLRGNISYTYDGSGNVSSRTDENGHTTTYTYDLNNNVATATAPINSTTSATTTYTYNSLGEVLTTTDPMGFVTTNTYDANGNLLSVTTPAPNGNTAASKTQFAYNSVGELTQITDPLNNVTGLTYTSAGLIGTITDAQNNVTTYGYDSHGNRTSVTDALNHQTTFTYDSMDRLTKITYPDTTTTQFAYDYRGRRTTVTDQNGKVTAYTYDDADRLVTVTDAGNNVTTYGYDTENNLTSIKDANNNTTSFSYDTFGRVTQTTFPSGLYESYGYDAVGNLTSRTDRKSQQITYTYDQLNRLMQKTYPDTSTVNYTYDLDSRLTQVTDPTGTYLFTFDNMGRLTNTTTNYAFLTGRNFTTAYGYDAASNRTGFTDPESGATSYAYDTLNRLQTLTPPSAFVSSGNFGFSYDALSHRTQLTRPNGLSSIYAYDNLSRLTSVLHQSGSTTLDGASYAVDNAGNRTSRTPQPSGTASNYSYDNIYELTGVTQGSTTTESYTYDLVGNRLTSLAGSFSSNSSNEMTASPTATYTYDYNGNTLTKVVGSNTTSFAWDFENRLTQVTLPGSGGTVSFKYDPFGRRIYKSSSSGTSIFAFDGDNLVEETNASGTTVARYSQGLNIDEPLAMLRSGATSFYHADGLGSVTSLSNSSGAIAQTYTFDSFGKLTNSSGSLTNPFQYTARESDAETGLYYYRARYYDPQSGRFLSEDPAGFVVATDLYVYVNNKPTRLVDPSGLFDLDFIETWTHSSEPWWDFTQWGIASTQASANLNVHCVPVGNCGWQRRIKLTVHFDVVYDFFSRSHEREHIEVAESILKNSAPYFGYLERVTYKTKEACEAARQEVKQFFDSIWNSMLNTQTQVDWKHRLRDLFPR